MSDSLAEVKLEPGWLEREIAATEEEIKMPLKDWIEMIEKRKEPPHDP